VRTLLHAVTVLNALATNHTKAQKLTQQKRDARAPAEVEVRAEFAGASDISVPQPVKAQIPNFGRMLRGDTAAVSLTLFAYIEPGSLYRSE
jgi:hypothetical protein